VIFKKASLTKFGSWTAIEGAMMTETEFVPVTPGEILKEEFLAQYGLSQNQLAKAIGTSPNRIAEIISNRRRITADTALRLSLYFGNSPEFWMNLQSHYDLKMARRNLTRRCQAQLGSSAAAAQVTVQLFADNKE
jgi:antitoxin HigA-1